MGYNIDKFVALVDQNLVCNICAGVMKYAVITACGHSFCQLCLSTWLTKPDTESCPVCRTFTSRYEFIPNIGLRNIVMSLLVFCDNKEEGCNFVGKLEHLESHCQVCEFRNVQCVACHTNIRYFGLAEHYLYCESIVNDFSKDSVRNLLLIVGSLKREIANLQLELKQTNKALERSNKTVSEIDAKLANRETSLSLVSTPSQEFDHDYSYGYSPSSISKLSRFISKYLLSKPTYVDRNRIFMSIKRSFTYYHDNVGYAADVHMLLATAYASNWFPEHHRWILERWLEQVTHERFPRQQLS